MTHDYFEDRMLSAAELLRGVSAAQAHIERARKADPVAWAKFAERYIDAGGFNLSMLAQRCERLADECELKAGLLGAAKAIAATLEAAE